MLPCAWIQQMSLGPTQWCRKLFYSHCDFLLCKHNCISYAWLNFRKGVVRLNWVAKWVAAWKSRLKTTGLEVLRIFTRKILVSQLNIRGVCRCHASINLFWLRKILIVLFVTKKYQPFCVRTGGDALVKVPCSGLLPSIEVGLCYLRKWRRGESLCFILKQAQSM